MTTIGIQAKKFLSLSRYCLKEDLKLAKITVQITKKNDPIEYRGKQNEKLNLSSVYYKK